MVSVIIPVYNVEKYLAECIDSVLLQSYKNFELLLIDDGSKDNSSAICDEYAKKDYRIKIFHKKNGGLSSARNYGINKAIGEYIIFLDSDDFWTTNDCLEKLIKIADDFGADIVRGELKEVNEKGEDLLIKDISNKMDKQLRLLSSAEFYKNIINGENFSVLFLFKKKIFDSGLRFDEKRCFEEDVELNIRLFNNNLKCVYVPIIFYAYRKRQNSIVHTSSIAHLKDSFLLSDIFEDFSNRSNDELLKQVYRENAVMMYYHTLVTIAEEPYYNECRNIIKQLKLNERRKKILRWANRYGVIKKSYIFNILPPYISILLFRLRNKLKF